MHPQAILVDSTGAEEKYFLRAMRDEVKATNAALIELPAKPESRLSWISKLDSSALAGMFARPSHIIKPLILLQLGTRSALIFSSMLLRPGRAT